MSALRRGIVLALVLQAFSYPSEVSARVRSAECDFAVCRVATGGAEVSAGGVVTRSAKPYYRNTVERSKTALIRRRVTIERALTPACPGNDPNTLRALDNACQYLVTTCSIAGRGPGPMTWIWSRPLAADGTPSGPWVRTGESCNVPAGAVAAAVAARPILTLGAIRDAFRRVDFARPELHVQPEGDVTLVNLPTFFEVRWPTGGVQPQEIASVHLLGRTVRIRPLSKSFVYRFGDGERFGPTPDAGGTFPNGGIRHTYEKMATPSVTVVATYGGEFSVDGGQWQQVGETVVINGPPTSVQVREATARLEAG